MSVLANRLKHRVTFETQQLTRDSEKLAASVAWVTATITGGFALEHVPAEVLTGPGRERVESGQKQADIAARITVRWFPGLEASWRIVWEGEGQGQVFNIESWELDATARRELRIRCTTGKNDGQ